MWPLRAAESEQLPERLAGQCWCDPGQASGRGCPALHHLLTSRADVNEDGSVTAKARVAEAGSVKGVVISRGASALWSSAIVLSCGMRKEELLLRPLPVVVADCGGASGGLGYSRSAIRSCVSTVSLPIKVVTSLGLQ